MRLPLAPQIIQSERKRLKTTSSSFQLWLGFGKGTEDADPRTRSWGLRGDSEQKKGSQGIWRHNSSLSGEIAAGTSGEEQQDSWARVAEHPSPRGFHDSKYFSLGQLENRLGPERGWATAQPFRSFPETRLWFPEPEPKPAGTEETAHAPWGDQDSGTGDLWASKDNPLPQEATPWQRFLRKFSVTWSATARASLSILDPASAIFLAALMTSDVFFRGPLPLWNTV